MILLFYIPFLFLDVFCYATFIRFHFPRLPLLLLLSLVRRCRLLDQPNCNWWKRVIDVFFFFSLSTTDSLCSALLFGMSRVHSSFLLWLLLLLLWWFRSVRFVCKHGMRNLVYVRTVCQQHQTIDFFLAERQGRQGQCERCWCAPQWQTPQSCSYVTACMRHTKRHTHTHTLTTSNSKRMRWWNGAFSFVRGVLLEEGWRATEREHPPCVANVFVSA